MILYEYEGKQLLFNNGINIPVQQLVESSDEEIVVKPPLVLKAQVLSGKRAEAGGIVMVESGENLEKELNDLFNETINKEKVAIVLAEEKIEFLESFYLSISYDTDSRTPILAVSREGGTGIEERAAKTYQIDLLEPEKILNQVQTDYPIDSEVLAKTIGMFFEQDLLLLEINPLVGTADKRWVALDAKIKLDDDAKTRHEDWQFPPRLVAGRTPTKNEIEAKKIDEGDYRGTAGSAYFDLDGDIAILSSGGGISLTAMDALIKLGGKPANFTEYSGNPPKEKVTKLTKIVLSKPEIHGLWVIGTVAANFTDIHETLSGLVEGLRQAQAELNKKFEFPIVIRRGGPNEEEAFEMLRNIKDFDLHLQGEETSIDQSAKIMRDLAQKYADNQSHPELDSGSILEDAEMNSA